MMWMVHPTKERGEGSAFWDSFPSLRGGLYHRGYSKGEKAWSGYNHKKGSDGGAARLRP